MDGITPTLLAVAAFVLLLALVPAALKWAQARVPGGVRKLDVVTIWCPRWRSARISAS